MKKIFSVADNPALSITIISTILIAIISAIIVSCMFLTSYLSGKIEVTTQDVEIYYDEGYDKIIKDFTITKKYPKLIKDKNLTNKIKESMIKYDKEIIGKQEAELIYNEKTKSKFYLTILNRELETPLIINNHGLITWNKINGASGYEVIVNEQSYDSSREEFDLSKINIKSEIVTVKVRAVSSSKGHTYSDYSESIQLNKLKAPINIIYESDKIIWDKVEGAISYQIFINDVEYFYNDNYFQTPTFLLGENKIIVIALGDPMETIKSDSSSGIISKLISPTNFKLSNSTLTWESSYLNHEYKIIDRENDYYVKDKFFENYFEKDHDYVIKIKVLASSNLEVDSDWITFKIRESQLETPNNITLDNNILKWDEVINANRYKLLVDGKNYYVEDNFFDLSNIDILAGEVIITIRSEDTTNNFSDSDSSETQKYKKLASVNNIIFSDGKLRWSGVELATDYLVLINNFEVKTKTNELKYSDFLVGENQIKIFSLGINEETIISEFHEESLVKLDNNIVFSLNEENLTWNNNETNLIKIIIEDTEIDSSLKNYVLDYENKSKFKVESRVLANNNKEIDSDNNVEYLEVFKLKTPINIQFNNNILTWEHVLNANSYEIIINEQVFVKKDNYFSFSKEEVSSGELTYSVRAIDSTNKYYNSYPSLETEIYKLNTISNIVYNNGHISWDNVDKANKYQIKINNNSYFVADNYLLYDNFEVGKNDVEIIAVNSEVNTIVSSNKSFESLIKLNEIEGINYSNSLIKWESDYNGTHQYQIIVNGIIEKTYDTEINIKLNTNNENTITIQVLPSSSKEIESAIVIKVITIDKLDTPNILDINEGVITWQVVHNANKYEVSINNVKYDVSDPIININDYNRKDSIVKIKIKSLDTNLVHESSDYTEEIIINRLDKVEDIVYINGYLMWDNINYAELYYLKINGVNFTSESNSFEYENFNVGNNKVEIYSTGSKYTISSEIHTDNLLKLNKITNLSNETAKIVWDSNYLGYDYEVYFDNKSHFVNTNYYDGEIVYNIDFLLKVRVVANSNKEITSDFEERIFRVNRLEQPAARLIAGQYANTFEVIINNPLPNIKYELTIRLYTGDSYTEKTVVYEGKYHEIRAGLSTKIEVDIVAIDTSGKLLPSDKLTLIRNR